MAANEDEIDVRSFTQGIRRKIVADLMPEDNVPKDADTQRVILTALNDMDRTDIGFKRIKQEDKRSNNDTVITDLVAAIIHSPQARNSLIGLTTGRSIVDTPPTDLAPDVKLVPGELDIGHHDLTYNSIIGGDGEH